MPDTDIDNVRPVNPQFFDSVIKNPGLSITAKESLVNEALAGRVRLEEVRSQLTKNQQQERLGDLRIEREEFVLSQAREKAAQDKAAVAKAGELSSTFADLLDDPELSPEQKRNHMARIRLLNPDAFTRSDTLRDQYQTLDRALPAPAKGLTVSEQIAIENHKRSLTEDQRKAFEDFQSNKQKSADRVFTAFEEQFQRVEGARFKKPDGSFLDDAQFVDEFEEPEDRSSIVSFIGTYGPHAGVSIPSEDVLSNMGAGDLLKLAGQVGGKLRPVLLQERGALPGGSAGSSNLGIPERL